MPPPPSFRSDLCMKCFASPSHHEVIAPATQKRICPIHAHAAKWYPHHEKRTTTHPQPHESVALARYPPSANTAQPPDPTHKHAFGKNAQKSFCKETFQTTKAPRKSRCIKQNSGAQGLKLRVFHGFENVFDNEISRSSSNRDKASQEVDCCLIYPFCPIVVDLHPRKPIAYA